jgi:hypothetical protein
LLICKRHGCCNHFAVLHEVTNHVC